MTTIEALLRTVSDEFERYAKVKKNIPEEALAAVGETESRPSWPIWWPGHLGIEVEQKQELLETLRSASGWRRSMA